MVSGQVVATVVTLLPTVLGLVKPRSLETGCTFSNAPTIPYFWDTSCPDDGTSLGCLADGEHAQCRFCGAGDYSDVYCPASWCEFDNPPHLPYYWDSKCTMGDVGCLADGKNVQCRFCGEFPYNNTVHCPAGANAIVPSSSCSFSNEPMIPYFWDATCEDGMVGCLADGKHLGCRFCGAGNYTEVECPSSLCTFEPRQNLPSEHYRYYWDPRCWDSASHILGCKADGIHEECRYCGTKEYKDIPCPSWASHR